MFMRKLNVIKISILYKLIYGFNAIPIKILRGPFFFFCRKQVNFKIPMKMSKT